MIKLFNQSIGRLRLTKTKSLTLASLLVGALVTLLSAPLQAAPGGPPADTFVILLSGTYGPVKHCPNLGLLQVNPCDPLYITTKIYPESGLPEENQGQGTIGNFYAAAGHPNLPVAYDLPGGALTMFFTANNVQSVPDGQGGTFIVGTFELNITEATGIYQSFVGGHNKMVDILHRLADGTRVEHCFCIISRS
jgi:hypothetical protein